jgi:hypothetical protein
MKCCAAAGGARQWAPQPRTSSPCGSILSCATLLERARRDRETTSSVIRKALHKYLGVA